MRSVVGALAVFALTVTLLATAHAQPVSPEDPLPPEPKGAATNTRIPIAGPDRTEVLGTEPSAAVPMPPVISLEHPIDPDLYVCGPGDVFELNFWGQQNFRLRITTDLEGRAFISKVGFVTVSGKTLTAVRKEVQRKVRGNYPGLSFDLALFSPRSFLVHIVNNVKAPGSYSAHPLERVSVVLSRAGGVTGSRRRIEIRHSDGSKALADLVKYELTGDTRLDPYLLDGDVVDVPFAQLTATITGAVRRPGAYELIATKDLAELIELAGGFTSMVVRTLPIRVVHQNAHSQDSFVELRFAGTEAPNAALHDTDRVEVRSADEIQRSVLLIGAVVGADNVDTATTSKRLPFVEGDTVWSLITRAGGVKSPGDLHRSYISRPRGSESPKLIAIDLEALLVKRELAADVPIEMNDTIVIPPMQYSVLVEGAVGRAGLYPFNPQFGIAEYIAHAGGRTRTAEDLDEVKVIDWNGRTHDYAAGIKPAPGDAILVPERSFTRPEIVQIAIAAAGLVLSGVAITIAATR